MILKTHVNAYRAAEGDQLQYSLEKEEDRKDDVHEC